MSHLNAAPDPLSFQGADARKSPLRIALWCLYEGIVKDGYLFKNRDAGLGADLLKGWCDLYTYGQAYGFEFLTFDQVTDWGTVDAIILCDRPLPGNPLVETAMRSVVHKYLVTAECPIIYAESWDKEYHRQFHRVWTWDDSLVDGSHYLKGNTVTDPTLAFDFEVLKEEFHNRKLVTIIAGAKASGHLQELYSHRIRTIQWFEATAPHDFDLYGMGWDKAMFPSYKGSVRDKLETLSRYRFSICYENAQGYPGYITEKLIDCLRSGTVPVYGGAPNVTRWIPQDCFIAISQFSTYFEMYEHLKNMDAKTHASYLGNIQRFVTGPEFYPFSIACMVEGFTKTLWWDLREHQDGFALLQNTVTLQMERHQIATPEQKVPLVVWMHYDPGNTQHQKLRGIWHFFVTHFPDDRFFFVRHASNLGRGEILDNGHDVLVGGDADLTTAIHDMVLRRYPQDFLLLHARLDQVFDPAAVRAIGATLGIRTSAEGAFGTLLCRSAVDAFKRHRHAGGSSPDSTVIDNLMKFGEAVVDSSPETNDPWRMLEQMQSILSKTTAP
jgi:hypothetical protein